MISLVTHQDMGESLQIKENGKFEAVSQVFFTDREATVDLQLNGMQLIFRELANGNRPMLCTGVLYQGTWYGDAPDADPATNPFTGSPVLEPKPMVNTNNPRKFIEITSDMLDMAEDYPFSKQEIPFGTTYDTVPMVIPSAQHEHPSTNNTVLNVYDVTKTGFKFRTNTKLLAPFNTDTTQGVKIFVEVVATS